MNEMMQVKSALISVFDKEGLAPIVQALDAEGVSIYSTGGTERYIRDMGVAVTAVESLTKYPSILGGRVKTLHPKIFGGILARRNHEEDARILSQYDISEVDLVIIDLYPFEQTLAKGATEQEIIEKIDIGGISLIRAAAKNYKYVMCISSKDDYNDFLDLLSQNGAKISLADRKRFAAKAFSVSSYYDTAIYNYFNSEKDQLRLSYQQHFQLRYGENPHQNGVFFGDIDKLFDQLHGKALSYNNFLDLDAAVSLIQEFSNDLPTFAVLKHNNACGLAMADSLLMAYLKALAADSVSAFGGVLITNSSIDLVTADELHKLFFEVIIAPGFSPEALKVLTQKKNRIILRQKSIVLPNYQLRTCLDGILRQDRDNHTDQVTEAKTVTKATPTASQMNDLAFASKICKHTKSNAIVLVKDNQLLASGAGHTSRVDALQYAINKAIHFGFDLHGAVMASDAFFPFPDCVDISAKAGIASIIQPGGSIKDSLSIEACDTHGISMLFTRIRHFKH